ncbi:MAG: hypothetical protein ISS69_16030 [Phycisphaerae bacterium]|nr:hypothetical protein [Planctomycetota bacterium]MBL7221620.1 hypothetical protein [Phycisphaerae bacterium]
MQYKCPGSSSSKPLDSTIITCPSCGADVELFSDEPMLRCGCGTVVRREIMPRCADWCPAAADCLGDAADPELLEKRRNEIMNNPHALECIARIAALIKEKRAGR